LCSFFFSFLPPEEFFKKKVGHLGVGSRSGSALLREGFFFLPLFPPPLTLKLVVGKRPDAGASRPSRLPLSRAKRVFFFFLSLPLSLARTDGRRGHSQAKNSTVGLDLIENLGAVR